MTYETLEESHQSGEPVEIYTFTRGGVVIGRYTSADAAVTVDGNLFSTWPGGIQRAEVIITTEQGRSSLRLTVARDFPIAQILQRRGRSGVIGVTAQRYHRADASDVIAFWPGGRCLMAKRTKSGARELICEPRSVSYSRNGLTRKTAPGCQHVLYGPRCRLDQDDWVHATTITALSGNTMSVASVEAGWPYTGGTVEWTDDDGITDVVFIVEADGTAFVLDLPIYGTAISDAVNIFPGCDWTMNTCHTIFANSENHGGRLNIPKKNPVTESPFA
jgi:uncharacterized phage protein (TIGR02218 family)